MKNRDNKSRIASLITVILMVCMLCSACSIEHESAPKTEAEGITVAEQDPEIEKESIETGDTKKKSDMTENESSTEQTEEETIKSEKEQQTILKWKKCAEYDMAYLFVNGLPEKDNDFYLLKDSDRRIITEEEIKDFNEDKLEIARNEIYARKGYIPEKAFIQAYFINQQWYQPFTDDISKLDLNGFEKENIGLIENKLKTAEGVIERKNTSQGYPIYGFDGLSCEMSYDFGDYITGSQTNIFYYKWYRNDPEGKRSFGEVLVNEVYPLNEGHKFIRTVPAYKEENGVFVKTEISTEESYRFISKDIRGIESQKTGTMIITAVIDKGEFRYIPVYRNDETDMEFYCEDGICLYDHINEEEFNLPAWYLTQFMFNVSWGDEGRSTYNSKTGELVKNKYAEDTEMYTTMYKLNREEMDIIHSRICDLDLEEGQHEIPPSTAENSKQSFALTYEWERYSGTTVQINCKNLGSDYKTGVEKQVSELRDIIVEILTSTEEWKKMPD